MKVLNVPDHSKVSFLVANNDPKIREQIGKILELNYAHSEVIKLFENQDLLDKLMKYRPNILIVDVDRDRIGFQIIKLIDMLKINVDIVAIGARSTEKIALCLYNGVKGYIIKPIDNMFMIRTIDDILGPFRHFDQRSLWRGANILKFSQT